MSSNLDNRPESDQPILRVRGPADMVSAIPYLIGFHPVRSLVLIGLDPRRRGRVVVTARMDLCDVADSAALVGQTLAGLVRSSAGKLIAAIFDDDAEPDAALVAELGPQRLPWAGMAAEVAELAGRAALDIDDVVLVCRGRMWSYRCAIAECCPPDGRVLGSSAVPAELTYAGMVALPDRESLEATLDPLPGPDRDQLLFALDLGEYDAVGVILRGDDVKLDRSVKRAIFAAARESETPTAAPLGDDDVVRFGVALQRLTVRDPVWLAVDDGRLDGRALWRDLARRLPAPFDAPALFLFAWASYRAGNGALAGMAAERALSGDPTYAAADLVLAALSNAVDPRTLPKLRSRRSA